MARRQRGHGRDHARRDVVLSWPITLLALTLLPLFVLPARSVGTRLAEITRERSRLYGEMVG